MFRVCVYVCAFFCVYVQVEALRRADHPSKESYRLSLIKKLRKLSPMLQKREQAPGVGATREKKNIQNSRNISVDIATGYGLQGRGSIPGTARSFFYSTASRPTLGPTQPPLQWVQGNLSPGVNRLGRETDHSPPSSAEVNNGGTIPPLPHTSSWRGA
jgi:hypothetical protein